jgi:prepilin peptidase dependent protein B
VRARREPPLPVSAAGFSLPEILIALAISSVLLLGAARFLPALQREALRGAQKITLEEEIWQRAFTVAKHLQRAGYCRESCGGEGLTIGRQGACVLVRWGAERTGFRLQELALETLRGATRCEGKGWERMTDPQAIVIEQFQVQRHNLVGFAPLLTVRLRGFSRSDSRERAAAEYSVTGFNL